MKGKQIGKLMFSFVLCAATLTGAFGCGGVPEETEKTEPEIDYGVVLGEIVADRKSDYTVVVPEDYTACEMYAAEELQSILAQSTGIYLPIRSENQTLYNAEKKIISIGHTEILDRYPHGFDYTSLNGDGFYIKTFDKSLFISGAIDRGTLYGVYEFVERMLGVRFFAEDCTYIPEYSEIKLYKTNIKEVPAFQYRAALQRSIFRTDADRVLYARMRNTHEFITIDEKYGGQISWYAGSENHNTMKYVPLDKYYATPEQKEQNRDMYVFNGDTPYDICWTNGLLEDGTVDQTREVSTIKAAIESLESFVADRPDCEFYMLGQMDFKTACTCRDCQESIRKYGQSGTIIRFANRLMKEVQAWIDEQPEYRGKTLNLVIFSYLYSSDAPVRYNDETKAFEPFDLSVVPDENMWIKLAPFNADRYHSLEDPDQVNKTFASYLDQWQAVTDNLMAWTYGAQYSHYFFYHPTVQKVKKEFTEFRDAGVTYMMEQLCTTERNSVQSTMDLYVMSKMLWDPDRDPYALRKEFVEHYVGAAGEEILSALEFMDEYYYQNQLETNGAFMYSGQIDAKYHPIEYLEQVYDMMEKGAADIRAADLTDAEKDVYLKRVKKYKLIPLYMMLINRDVYFRDDPERYNGVTREFFAICDELGVEEYGETYSLESLKGKYPFSK